MIDCTLIVRMNGPHSLEIICIFFTYLPATSDVGTENGPRVELFTLPTTAFSKSFIVPVKSGLVKIKKSTTTLPLLLKEKMQNKRVNSTQQ